MHPNATLHSSTQFNSSGKIKDLTLTKVQFEQKLEPTLRLLTCESSTPPGDGELPADDGLADLDQVDCTLGS